MVCRFVRERIIAHHQVGQGNTCGQHSHSDFATLWLGALFLKQPKCIESSVVGDDDLRVPHEPLTCDNLPLLTRIGATESVLLCMLNEKLTAFLELERAIYGCGEFT